MLGSTAAVVGVVDEGVDVLVVDVLDVLDVDVLDVLEVDVVDVVVVVTPGWLKAASGLTIPNPVGAVKPAGLSSGTALFSSAVAICAGVSAGFTDRNNATAADTCGVAIEVPLMET